MSNDASTPQSGPTGTGEAILFYVQSDILARAGMGHRKYGTFLRSHNGRDALVDAYQESIDLVMYLRQLQMDLEAKDRTLARLFKAILDWINQDETQSKQHWERALIRTFQDVCPLLDGREWNEYPKKGRKGNGKG